MNFDTALHSLETEGFRWDSIQKYFPFGDESLREGKYQRLVQAAIDSLESNEERQLLLDLLDAQACVFTEQVWVANEMAEKSDDERPFPMAAHFSMAWLQINDNLRFAHGIPARSARGAMLDLKQTETLIGRIISRSADS